MWVCMCTTGNTLDLFRCGDSAGVCVCLVEVTFPPASFFFLVQHIQLLRHMHLHLHMHISKDHTSSCLLKRDFLKKGLEDVKTPQTYQTT